MWRRLVAGLAVGAVAAAAPACAQAGFAKVDGRRVYFQCRGTGRPTVVLVSGFRNRGDIWNESDVKRESPVFSAVARSTRVCEYDRPGTTIGSTDRSRSQPVKMPRTIDDLARELHGLLPHLRPRGPVVLVGHSLGGLVVRRFAAKWPRRVAGLVLVDALSERIRPLLGPRWWPTYRTLLSSVPPELAGYRQLEDVRFDASFDQVRRATARPVPRSLPYLVISKGLPFPLPAGLPDGFGNALERAWQAAQGALAALRPGTPHLVAARSGHYVQVEQPMLVSRAVLRIAAAANTRSRR